ncbi:MAG: efflux RND transporter periplasmic adaptor subunit [Capsulimonadales bacterium]|nr:efflux RND transporter periplasmic adaptor subunit [Capsulimonadales bacterium]
MNSKVRLALIAVVIVGIVAFAWSRLTTKTTDKPKIGRIVEAKTGTISLTVAENGTLEPVNQVEVKSRVAGRILKIYVREGDRVKAGDMIALVDPTEVARDVNRIKAQLSASQARLAQSEENYYYAQRQSLVAVERAKANLKEAQRRLAQTAAPTRIQELRQQEESVNRAELALKRADANLARADAAIQRSDAQIVDARRNLERQKILVAKGFVAQSALDTADTNVRLAVADKAAQEADRKAQEADRRSLEADLATARQRLSLLREGPRVEDIRAAQAAVETARVGLRAEMVNARQVEVRKRDIEQAQAEVAQIENTLAQQNVQLTETRIVAPVSGEITGKYLNEGELVASATSGFAQGAVLVRVADLNKMQVRVNVNEVDVARLKVNLPVEIKVDSIPGVTFKGHVTDIAPSSIGSAASGTSGSSSGQQAVVRFEVKVRVDTPDQRLRPGMTAAVNIILDRHENVTILSNEALREGDKVMVVTGTGKDMKTTERVLKIGIRNYGEAEVLEGLKPGEKVEVPKIVAKDRRKINVEGPDGEENSGDGSSGEGGGEGK